MRILLVGALLASANFLCIAQQPAQPDTPVVVAPQTPDPSDGEAPKKEKLPPKGVIHLQEVKDVPVVHAKQACPNFSWAASLETVLMKETVDLPQGYWVDKYYGGEVCLDAIGDPDDLIRKGSGEYTLEDGRHIQIDMQYFPGLPSNASALLVPIMHDELLIFFLDGKAEVLTGAMWDDYLSNRGERMIDLKELHLLDPLQGPESEKTILDATSNELNRVSGWMKVAATEVNKQYWPK